MPSAPSKKEDRLFVRQGRRTYRRRYSVTEVRVGLAALLVLLATAAWVAWKGAHPDPELFDTAPDLLAGQPTATDRGPLPAGLAPTGWREQAPSRFDPENLYVKINGREDFYKSFGFEHLYWVSLQSADDATVTVDIELYDLGRAPNALGAFAGERPADAGVVVDEDGGMHLLARNALFMTRGRYYLRAIGSEESPPITTVLEHLQETFRQQLTGEPLPWAYALFVDELHLDPDAISYMPENAFSFGFASNVWAAVQPDGETESFVVFTPTRKQATQLASRFERGFLEYGTHTENGSGSKNGQAAASIPWIKDRYLGRVSAAAAHDHWVVGVRAAADVERGSGILDALTSAVEALPAGVVERAASESTRHQSGVEETEPTPPVAVEPDR